MAERHNGRMALKRTQNPTLERGAVNGTLSKAALSNKQARHQRRNIQEKPKQTMTEIKATTKKQNIPEEMAEWPRGTMAEWPLNELRIQPSRGVPLTAPSQRLPSAINKPGIKGATFNQIQNRPRHTHLSTHATRLKLARDNCY
jgi:hypothetical protein